MKNKIDTILNELYLIDPQFRSHEVPLRELVSKLLAAAPDTQFNPAFAEQLKARVLAEFEKEMEAVKQQRPVRGNIVSPYITYLSNHFFILFRTWAPALIVLILLPFSYLGMKQLINRGAETGFSVQQEISDKGTKAFGTLPVPTVVHTPSLPFMQPSVTPTPALVQPFSNKGTAVSSVPNAAMKSTVGETPASFGSNISTLSIRPPTEQTTFPVNYVYKGVPLALTENSGKVYKRMSTSGVTTDFSSLVQNSDFSVINLSDFTHLKPRTMELSENGDLAYSVSVDFMQGQITINPLWDSWAQVFNTQGEFTIPNDQSLISVSNAFLKQHGIDISLYTTPLVIHDEYHKTGGKVGPQDTITVLYPVTINGLTVYDENAQPYGLQVLINVQTKRVASVLNLTSQKYESASYDLVTDPNQILAEATSSATTGQNGSSVTEIELETPQPILMKVWKTDDDGTNGEFYVPALLFKAVNEQATSTPLQPIIVPLTKESFDTPTSSSTITTPQI